MLTLKSKEIDRCAVEGNLFELCGEFFFIVSAETQDAKWRRGKFAGTFK